jgi:hypothetical protein
VLGVAALELELQRFLGSEGDLRAAGDRSLDPRDDVLAAARVPYDAGRGSGPSSAACARPSRRRGTTAGASPIGPGGRRNRPAGCTKLIKIERADKQATARRRDRLTDHYFDVGLDVLWATVTEDFPLLLDVLPDVAPRADADR